MSPLDAMPNKYAAAIASSKGLSRSCIDIERALIAENVYWAIKEVNAAQNNLNEVRTQIDNINGLQAIPWVGFAPPPPRPPLWEQLRTIGKPILWIFFFGVGLGAMMIVILARYTNLL